MRVQFCAECKGKALKNTRKILDDYAVRTGSRTWLAEITEKGLETVRSKLFQKATKNTAVQCLVVDRKTKQRKWIVGDRSVFGPNGEYPVARTSKAYVAPDETTWARLPLVASLTAIAALFHDIGKLSKRFQKKLKDSVLGKNVSADPIRHEYISCMVLREFIDQVGAKTDKEWIEKLPLIDVNELFSKLESKTTKANIEDPENPFLDMQDFPVFLSICWLVVSHHRLPYSKGEPRPGMNLNEGIGWHNLAYFIYAEAGYLNPTESSLAAEECRTLSTAFESSCWRKLLTKYSSRLAAQIDLYPDIFEKPDFSLFTYSRMALVFGDHTFSATDCRKEKNGPYANTIEENGKRYFNQSLEEHLAGVCSNAVSFIYKLPKIAHQDKAFDIEWLGQRSTGRFRWQEKAATLISDLKKDNSPSGFFIVNMAGTGTGKTLGNAKMLYALDGEGLRGTIALGLRSLTVQTGKEYRERMGLFEEDLCISMGSKEAAELKEEIDEDDNPEPLVDYDIMYGRTSEELFSQKDKLASKFLGSPVLVCTIDQIIKTTETTRGGQGIIPGTRMLSSDIVIDEIDDYMNGSLVAVGRLVYYAGTMGRNVILSSATISPEISLNLKYYYDEGYKEYLKWHKKTASTIGIVVDEHNCKTFSTAEEYVSFCRDHVKKTLEAPLCRKGEISKIELPDNIKDRPGSFYNAILENISMMHLRHGSVRNGKKISFGLVRFANISQLVEFAIYLGAQDQKEIIPIVYHSRFPLAYRHYIESYLDRVLCRKEPEDIFDDPVIAAHIEKAEKNAIFIVLASPVEEIGRDHDFDWCIIEASSYRSIIQTAGRVMRHRLIVPGKPNVAILEYNASFSLKGRTPCFLNPGFESDENQLSSHDLFDLCDCESLAKGITSAPRVLPISDISEQFATLEHEVTQQWLDPERLSPDKISGYVNGFFFTGLPQKKAKLRDDQFNFRMIYKHEGKGKMNFFDASEKKKITTISESQHIKFLEDFKEPNWWLKIDHDEIVDELSRKMGVSKERFENRYCIIDIPDNRKSDYRDFKFNPSLGLFD